MAPQKHKEPHPSSPLDQASNRGNRVHPSWVAFHRGERRLERYEHRRLLHPSLALEARHDRMVYAPHEGSDEAFHADSRAVGSVSISSAHDPEAVIVSSYSTLDA